MNTPAYPMCGRCGHSVSSLLGGERGRCTTIVGYPPGDPRGLGGYCDCPCAMADPGIRAWAGLKPIPEWKEEWLAKFGMMPPADLLVPCPAWHYLPGPYQDDANDCPAVFSHGAQRQLWGGKKEGNS